MNPNHYGQKIRVQAYITPDAFKIINAERLAENASVSEYVGAILEMIFIEEPKSVTGD